ncbi:uncharacterized protein LOC142980303 [Anticarsia gemmatalis]|uniref:uncharacterized protein LOC142980303 n=1 Tax=Anticarsia gemmatalis TaxID=129554 RepID=UPI003F769FD8
MKLLCVVTLLGFVAVVQSVDEEVLLNYKFDDILDSKQEDLIKEYFDCLLDKIPCSNELQRVKDNVIEIIKNKCAECTPELKQLDNYLQRRFKERYPKKMNEFLTKVYSSK